MYRNRACRVSSRGNNYRNKIDPAVHDEMMEGFFVFDQNGMKTYFTLEGFKNRSKLPLLKKIYTPLFVKNVDSKSDKYGLFAVTAASHYLSCIFHGVAFGLLLDAANAFQMSPKIALPLLFVTGLKSAFHIAAGLTRTIQNQFSNSEYHKFTGYKVSYTVEKKPVTDSPTAHVRPNQLG